MSARQTKKYDVFLSHNSLDKPIVEEIAQWLVKESYKVWFDKWELIVGEAWQEELELGLSHSACCIIFFGSNKLSPWQNEEMRVALSAKASNRSIRVIPVLLPLAKNEEKESQLPAFLQRLTWVKFENNIYEAEPLRRLKCGIDGIPPGRPSKISNKRTSEKNPFKGLEAFGEKDKEYFFGRDFFIQKLKNHIDLYKLLILTGPSGSGKSSIILAGLVPLLRESNLITAIFTPRIDPINELTVALKRSIETKQTGESLKKELKNSESGEALYFFLRHFTSEDKKMLLIVDQFEEIFTQTTEDLRIQFINLLLKARDDENVRIILTMRSDFIGNCAVYPNLNLLVNDHLVQIGPMSEDELRAAIVEPSMLENLRLEEGLVDRIISDSKGASSELPLIEYALSELWRKRQGNTLTNIAYKSIGGVEGALVNRADAEYNLLSPSEQQLLRRMISLRLIQPGDGAMDTKRKASKTELHSMGEEKSVEKMIQLWTGKNLRMMTVYEDPISKQVYVELAHETLIRNWGKIQEWMQEDRETSKIINKIRLLAIDYTNLGEDYLLHGTQLQHVIKFSDILSGRLTETEEKFIKDSIERERTLKAREFKTAQDLKNAKSRSLTLLVITLIIIFLGLTTVTILFYSKKQTLNEYERLADSERINRAKTEAEKLWPLGPKSIEPLNQWIINYSFLINRLKLHQAALDRLRLSALQYTHKEKLADFFPEITALKNAVEAETKIKSRLMYAKEKEKPPLKKQLKEEEERIAKLRSDTAGRRTWNFGDDLEKQFRHDILSKLVVALTDFSAKNGLFADIKARLNKSKKIKKSTIDDFKAQWAQVNMRLARSKKYMNLRLSPQLGLIPLGPDPKSGLEEFIDWQTNEKELPERAETGSFTIKPSTGIIFVLIPEGEFYMGAQKKTPSLTNYDRQALENEMPVRKVKLKAFFLSKYEMTQGQWLRITGKNPSFHKPGYIRQPMPSPVTLSHPVEQVSWNEAKSTLSKLGLDLPTEAQWERAARADLNLIYAGTSKISELSRFSNIGGIEAKKVWPDLKSTYKDSWLIHSPVGSFEPNNFGLYDMTGNVFEWCKDQYSDYSIPPRNGDGLRISGETARIDRGGGFAYDQLSARIASRNKVDPDYKDYFLGVRPVRLISYLK
ncbi:SUMF1/EgtB/PvdO family nonheme iron enzyme [Mucilaginibacter rubeus]|uniref:SUMF1/EgtB/PvdO family nonheme iron enzyme n=1 Tax=Mucilaginibacter rubeus TaxID=2027860 RepID=A0A5C1HSQ4_9SPHI|nr:SUMF1/EgtB/PvdO family nonheme iron enzyme [Mucilaginibacter rubeus]QEM08854.1 SUMF1/EgtB/PvdO family nonheme iron enzyme [Mucilaginibacter rubeus]